jgi:hypothetical protein
MVFLKKNILTIFTKYYDVYAEILQGEVLNKDGQNIDIIVHY